MVNITTKCKSYCCFVEYIVSGGGGEGGEIEEGLSFGLY